MPQCLGQLLQGQVVELVDSAQGVELVDSEQGVGSVDSAQGVESVDSAQEVESVLVVPEEPGPQVDAPQVQCSRGRRLGVPPQAISSDPLLSMPSHPPLLSPLPD